MSRPWWQLKPTDGSESPQPPPYMTFPALVARRYVVVRMENGYFLSETVPHSAATVVVIVDQESNVTVNVGANAEIEVQVNDQTIEKGGTSRVLKDGDRLKLGDQCFGLKRLPSHIAEIRSSIRQLVQCAICLRSCQRPHLLRCGHTFCQQCLSQMINLAMRAAHVDQPRFEAAAFGLDEHELLQQTRSIKCGVCRQQFSCWEANRAYQPHALTEALTMMQEWIDYDETRPKCAACHNARCLVDPRDYEYCEWCRMILCPVCAVEGHRAHKLRERKDIVAAMHESGKRLAQMKIELQRLRRLRHVVQEKADETAEEYQRQYLMILPPVRDAVTRCRQTLQPIEMAAAQPFADIDAEQLAQFDERTKKAQQQIDKANQIIDRVTNLLQELKEMMPPSSDAVVV